MVKRVFFIIVIILLLAFSIVNAHEGEVEEEISIDEHHKAASLNFLLITSLWVIILVMVSLRYKEKKEQTKWLLFLGILTPVLASTAYLVYSTVYVNIISETQGPVHWHADYEIWNCGQKIELIKPQGFSNKIGDSLFHDHGDSRMHVEGTVLKISNVDLHQFFETLGGNLESGSLAIPTENGLIETKNGDLCNYNEGILQVFLYRIKNPDEVKSWLFEQKKLEDFEEYVLSPYSNIPPGDCIIVEFGPEKQKTEHICATYKAAMERGELSGG